MTTPKYLKKTMKIAIMQPYFFPYLGYFQLINQCNKFIIYNDVQFIERGWINRNNFLINKTPTLVSVPLLKASCSKKINEIEIDYNNKQLKAGSRQKKLDLINAFNPEWKDLFEDL